MDPPDRRQPADEKAPGHSKDDPAAKIGCRRKPKAPFNGRAIAGIHK
jgi:hypothetical protein